MVCLVLTATAEARDLKQRYAFRKENPCPVTGKARGACQGYVVDHITPLCAGGPDLPSNMQWQTVEDAKKKDLVEIAHCRRGHGQAAPKASTTSP